MTRSLTDKTLTDKTLTDKTTSRRKFLKGGLLAGTATAATGLSAPAVLAQAPKTLKMQGAWPASNLFSDWARQMVERINAMSGRIKVEYLPSGAVVKAFQIQDAVSDGVLDGGHQVCAYWYGKNKAASLFGTGPVFGVDGNQLLAWVNNGGGQALYDELVQEILGLNLVGWFSMPCPTQPLGWFNKEVNSAADMKGLKYRTVGLATDVMEAMGVNVTQLPGGEIVPALERGVIEAFEFNNPTSDMQFGAQDVAKYYYMSSYHQANEFIETVWNKDVYEGLDPADQAILRYCNEAAATANFGLTMDDCSRDLQKLIKGGTIVKRTDESILKAELDAWDRVVAKLSSDPFFKKVIDSQKAWGERVGFYMLMNQCDYALAYRHYFPGKLPDNV